jgi:hypothetical protein
VIEGEAMFAPTASPPGRRISGHREALEVARRLQLADDASAAEARRALLLYWYGTGAGHLRTEEHLLLAAWERHGGLDHPLNGAIRAEHTRLRHAVRAVAHDETSSAATLGRLGHDLEAHVHREERELLPIILHVVPRSELADVLDSLAGLERR